MLPNSRDFSLTRALDKIGPLQVSVIIPCYNQVQFLQEAVDSVLAQTYPHWECILVNDGSTDETLELAAAIVAANPKQRFSVINQLNQGLSSARNAGIRASQGHFILPLDSDDMIDPRMIDTQVARMLSDSSISIVHTDVRYFGHTEEVHQTGPFELELLKTGNRICYCSLFRREVWEESGGYNPNMTIGYEDWDFWVGAAKRGRKAVRVPHPYLIYRTKAESMYTTAFKYDIFLRARIVGNHPEIYDQSAVQAANQILELHRLLLERSLGPAHQIAGNLAKTLQEQPFPAALGSLDRFLALIEAHQAEIDKEASLKRAVS